MKPEPKRSSPAKQKQKRLACPACVKSSLTERIAKDGLCVDVCRSCRGTWLDGGEFLQLAANKDEAKQELLLLYWEASKTKRRCPRCHSYMSESGFVNYETQIDFCEECDGLWFDAGELKEALQTIKASAPTTKRKRRQKSSSNTTVETLMTESQADESVSSRPIRIETACNALRVIRAWGLVPRSDGTDLEHSKSGFLSNIKLRKIGNFLKAAVHYFLIWIGLCLVWLGLRLSALGPWDREQAYSIFFGLNGIGCILIWGSFALRKNSTVVEITKDLLSVRHGPVLWPGNRSIPIEDLAQVFG